VPETVGGDEFAGAIVAACTTPLTTDVTGPVEPAVFDPVTVTAIVDPTSVLVSVYVDATAPSIPAHENPRLSQRTHWYASVGAGWPVQTPGEAVNT
jgi:hypothetical protein